MSLPFRYFPQFAKIGVLDTEFQSVPGERPRPVSFHYHELRSDRHLDWFVGEPNRGPPYDNETLVIGYYISAELGFARAMGWDDPGAALCAYIEFRNLTNGLPLPHGSGLIGAAAYLNIDYPADKDGTIKLINRGPPFTSKERATIQHYNAVDVDTTRRAVLKMYPSIEIDRSLYRGVFPAVAAEAEWRGLPMDRFNLDRLRRHWTNAQDRLIAKVNKNYNIYEGRSFRQARFAEYLRIKGIPWPRLDSGGLALDDDTFREIADIYPEEIGPLRELRHVLGKLRLNDLAVGSDDRNRTLSSYYRARTSRSQPSNAKSIFGTSVGLRPLIKPGPGWGVIVCDYSQQEFGTAAGLSGDPAMTRAYNVGDSYLGFAVEAGALSTLAAERYLARRKANLTDDVEDYRTHAIREVYKPVVLGIQYGRGEYGLARTLNLQPIQARVLLDKHHDAFSVFWEWSDARVRYAMFHRHTSTVMGWNYHVPDDTFDDAAGPLKNKLAIKGPNVRSLMNFAMQANAAEMTRLAACMAAEDGVPVLMTVHDAIVAEASISELPAVAQRLEQCMIEASGIILGGFTLRVDTKLIPFPQRYTDKRGEGLWRRLMELLDEIEAGDGRAVA